MSVGDSQRRFQEMYEQSLPAVYGFLMLRVGGNRSLAEDLTAETFLAAVKEYNADRSEVVTVSWLRTVAKRRLIDHWRRERVASDHSKKVTKIRADQPESIEERSVIVEALGHLAEAERVVLVLRHVEGHSVKEIAKTIERSPKATESLLGRARTSFRAAYEEVDND